MTTVSRLRWASCIALLGGIFGSSSGTPAAPLDALIREIRNVELRVGEAVAIRDFEMDTGLGTLVLQEGTLFPASAIDGRSMEMVFVGRGRFELDPPDRVEAGQIERFIGQPYVDASFRDAVLVVARDEAADALLVGRPRTTPDPETARRAEETFARWSSGPERERLGVDGAAFLDALGDPAGGTFFAAWLRSSALGDFLYAVEPDATEQISLAQFVPRESQRAEEKTIRELHAEQRRGRLIGRELEGEGTWDTWLSSSFRDRKGNVVAGRAPFEPAHYSLDVAIFPEDRRLSGSARIDLRAAVAGRRGFRLSLYPDLRVRDVTDPSGAALPFLQDGPEVVVGLPGPSADGGRQTVFVEYSGSRMSDGRFAAATGATGWYPRAGDVDRATYDVTLHFPAKHDLIASGQRVEGGSEDGGMRWIRHRFDEPVPDFGFEIGDFLVEEHQVGDIAVAVAFDRESTTLSEPARKEIQQTVRESLEYYQETFGSYPLDHLRVVITPREVSLGFLGFVILSERSMNDPGWPWIMLMPDRRAIVAHEIAHQWWGNIVGWKSYRDQWLSEAMANYASRLYAGSRRGGRVQRGMLPGWRGVLSATTEDGRPIESVGPIILGSRLDSSQVEQAHNAIVYLKGTVLLETLAATFQEGPFVDMLGQLVRAASNRDISTGGFLRSLERMSGIALDWFREYYVYGTGLPEVDYTYDFLPREGGGWTVKGEARQSPTYRLQYRVVRTPSGKLDVARERIDQVDVRGFHLVVPFQLLVEEDPDVDPDETKKRIQVGPRTEMHGRVVLRDERSTFQLDIDQKPVRFWLDRKREVPADFYCEIRQPKRVIFSQGLDLAAAGEWEAAEAAFRRALASPVAVGADARDLAGPELQGGGRQLDAEIHFHLARLYLDQERDTEARAEFELGQAKLDATDRWQQDQFMINVQSRLEMRQGDYGAAFRRLRRSLLISEGSRSTEGLVLLAIAAAQADRPDAKHVAMEMAMRQGADLSLLE